MPWNSADDPIEALEDPVRTETSKASAVLSDEATTLTSESTFRCSDNVDLNFQDLDAVASALSQSRNPEHLLMVALYGQDPTDGAGVNAMTRALQSDPDNPLVSWNFLQSCSRFPDAQICLDHRMEEHAIDVDGSNGQLWARIAGYRAERGEMREALAALSQTVVAPRFTDYRMEHIELFERGLAAAGNLPYRSRIVQAIGMQAALVSNEFHTMTACNKMATESSEWLSHCARFGARLERDGRSFFSVLVGQRLQENMHSISGDSEKQASVLKRLERTRQYMENGLSVDGQVLLLHDDQVLANYISTSATYGEIEALTFLNNEVERLKNLAGYDPCRLYKVESGE